MSQAEPQRLQCPVARATCTLRQGTWSWFGRRLIASFTACKHQSWPVPSSAGVVINQKQNTNGLAPRIRASNSAYPVGHAERDSGIQRLRYQRNKKKASYRHTTTQRCGYTDQDTARRASSSLITRVQCTPQKKMLLQICQKREPSTISRDSSYTRHATLTRRRRTGFTREQQL